MKRQQIDFKLVFIAIAVSAFTGVLLSEWASSAFNLPIPKSLLLAFCQLAIGILLVVVMHLIAKRKK